MKNLIEKWAKMVNEDYRKDLGLDESDSVTGHTARDGEIGEDDYEDVLRGLEDLKKEVTDKKTAADKKKLEDERKEREEERKAEQERKKEEQKKEGGEKEEPPEPMDENEELIDEYKKKNPNKPEVDVERVRMDIRNSIKGVLERYGYKEDVLDDMMQNVEDGLFDDSNMTSYLDL